MQARLIPTHELSEADRHAMYNLLSRHFEGVTVGGFERDLVEKNWAILLNDQTGALKGFSTLLFYETEFAGEPLSVVYSGDTIVDPTAWSSLALPQAWIASVNKLRRWYPNGRLYWLLISSGYRTYRFLPTFWREFYPRYDRPTPAPVQALMQQLSLDRFQSAYDASAGIVRFAHPQQLRSGLDGVPLERLHDAHIRFFLEQNPGHDRGDELVCLTEITETNLTRAGRRMWFAESEAIAV
ncbi:MAG: hypothetical protein HC881_17285 [Leptolyngbyaceae cyanobacterium SL_7_1]|nr:hypothetical protein [Leptolyngbyaceae cyanobacterium SL_7_1]